MTALGRLARWGWAIGLWSGACGGMAPQAAPVPLEGPQADLAALAGKWSGQYWSEEEQRHGTLTFFLQAGSDTARGEVNMTFARALKLYGERPDDDMARVPCTTMTITIVRVRADTIRGDLTPYWDPDCECRTRTVFEGAIKGDSVAGTFTSRRETTAMPLLTGRWFAVRK